MRIDLSVRRRRARKRWQVGQVIDSVQVVRSGELGRPISNVTVLSNDGDWISLESHDGKIDTFKVSELRDPRPAERRSHRRRILDHILDLLGLIP